MIAKLSALHVNSMQFKYAMVDSNVVNIGAKFQLQGKVKSEFPQQL